jgi:hypothetical protein
MAVARGARAVQALASLVAAGYITFVIRSGAPWARIRGRVGGAADGHVRAIHGLALRPQLDQAHSRPRARPPRAIAEKEGAFLHARARREGRATSTHHAAAGVTSLASPRSRDRLGSWLLPAAPLHLRVRQERALVPSQRITDSRRTADSSRKGGRGAVVRSHKPRPTRERSAARGVTPATPVAHRRRRGSRCAASARAKTAEVHLHHASALLLSVAGPRHSHQPSPGGRIA